MTMTDRERDLLEALRSLMNSCDCWAAVHDRTKAHRVIDALDAAEEEEPEALICGEETQS
jgi:hypothetical protein